MRLGTGGQLPRILASSEQFRAGHLDWMGPSLLYLTDKPATTLPVIGPVDLAKRSAWGSKRVSTAATQPAKALQSLLFSVEKAGKPSPHPQPKGRT